MASGSSAGGLRGFFAYYRVYARSGIHAASAAALTVFGVLASTVDPRFVAVAIAVYVLPPVFLYLTAEGERVPSVTEEHRGDSAADAEREAETEHESDAETDRQGHVTESEDGPATTTDGKSAVGDETTATDEMSSVADADESGPAHDSDEDTEHEWEEADVPTDATLTDVVSHDGAFAVGEGGVVLARDAEGWEIALDHGPAAESESLNGVAVTGDGSTVWFAGDNGALGRYDVSAGRHTDHSAPDSRTDTWADIAITGRAGEERIVIVNGSGEVLRGENDDGTIAWDEPTKPGSGSSIAGVVFGGDRGYLCDTNQSVYETTDGGESYEKIGIEGANTDFADLAAAEELVVAGGDGSVFRYDGTNWTTLRASEEVLSAIDLVEGTGLAAGDGGTVCELKGGDWGPTETPVENDLRGVAVGDGGPDIAVGAGGTVIECRR